MSAINTLGALIDQGYGLHAYYNNVACQHPAACAANVIPAKKDLDFIPRSC